MSDVELLKRLIRSVPRAVPGLRAMVVEAMAIVDLPTFGSASRLRDAGLPLHCMVSCDGQ